MHTIEVDIMVLAKMISNDKIITHSHGISIYSVHYEQMIGMIFISLIC